MASSAVKRSLCKACNKAPSVFFCQGCQQDFCSGHAKEHRQELSKQLDTIIVEHDQLKQNLADYTKKSNGHPLMKQIDKWENESIEKIRAAANDARKKLVNIVDGQISKIGEDLKSLTKEITAARSEDNFIEIDLKEWMDQLKKWTKDLSTPSSISIGKKNDVFIQKIFVNSVKIRDEIFERSIGPMKIEDNGQVVESLGGNHSTARCRGEYSSGEHKFRLKFEQLHLSPWICFGIVSKNTSLQQTSYDTPTSFSWTTANLVYINRVGSESYNGFKSDIIQNDIVQLILNCDQRKIRMKNERTNYEHELDVNITQCPFPWQVHVGLYYQNDRVRILNE